jgi:hypothetical protein
MGFGSCSNQTPSRKRKLELEDQDSFRSETLILNCVFIGFSRVCFIFDGKSCVVPFTEYRVGSILQNKECIIEKLRRTSCCVELGAWKSHVLVPCLLNHDARSRRFLC